MDLVSIPANPVPEGAVTGTLKTKDGVNLRFTRWHPPPGRKGTVVIFRNANDQMRVALEQFGVLDHGAHIEG